MRRIHRHAPLPLPVLVTVLLAALVTVLLAAGCGAHGAGPGGPPAAYGGSEAGRASASARIEVRVENQQFEDLTVYLVRRGVPLRLGVAEGYGTRTFRVPPALYGDGMDLLLRAEAIASRQRFESPLFHAEPGPVYRWTVHNRPGLSSFDVVLPGRVL